MNRIWFYNLVKATSWWALKLFFGRLEIIGRKGIPNDGALILAPNHQGAFMDAVVVGTYTKKPVSFLTRADVFNKWSAPFLKSLNMMPIYRIRDGIQSLSQNEQVFEQCFRVLSRAQPVLIFPEGNHSTNYFLRPLSKGASRLALDARDQLDPGKKIYVIPIGVNYFSHRRPLAGLKLVFGNPIELAKYQGLYKEHTQKAYNKFREDLTEAMKETLILPEEDENYEKKRDYIFQPKHENLPFAKLKEMGRSDYFEERKPRKTGAFARLFIGLLSILNIPALLILKKILSKVKELAFYTSIKYLVGGLLHFFWWIILFVTGALWIGWEAGLLFVVTAILMMFARQSIIKY